MYRKLIRAATAVLMSGGVGLAGFGMAAGTAQAQPIPAPMYHWCPGDFWDPGWGGNWDSGNCHDDFHRDIDGDWHGRDWHADWDRDHGGPGWDRDHGGPGWDRDHGGPGWDRDDHGGPGPWWPH